LDDVLVVPELIRNPNLLITNAIRKKEKKGRLVFFVFFLFVFGSRKEGKKGTKKHSLSSNI